MKKIKDDIERLFFETELESQSWDMIKDFFWSPRFVEKIEIDEENKTIATGFDGRIAQLGYVHVDYEMDKTSDFQEKILTMIFNVYSNLKAKKFDTQWDIIKITLITTYKLSDYKNIDFSKLPKNVNYFYVVNQLDNDNARINITEDKELLRQLK